MKNKILILHICNFMASTGSLNSVFSLSVLSPRRCCRKNGAVTLNPSQFLSSNSILKLKRPILLPNVQFKKFRNRRATALPNVFAAQSHFFRVVQTTWKIGKDGIEAVTNLVPDSIPRPIARISVTVVALTLVLFVLNSFLSTVFFVLSTMGLVYFIYIALNKDEAPRVDGGSTTSAEDSLEEARRIMEKYK